MEHYEELEISVIRFDSEDIICDSCDEIILGPL